MELNLIKTPMGLVPMDDECSAQLQRIRNGSVVRADYKEMRNGKFFRKYWALLDVAFDLVSDKVSPMQHNGLPVRMCKDQFRKDVTVLAGYYEPIFALDGSVQLKAKSLQWSKMSEEEFHKLYHDTLDVILQKLLTEKFQTDIEDMVERVLSFG